MKLAAIISRGTRRDFVDLYLLCRQIPLGELLARAPATSSATCATSRCRRSKASPTARTAAGEPMPPLAAPLDWEEVEAWLHGEVRALGRQHVGLEAG